MSGYVVHLTIPTWRYAIVTYAWDRRADGAHTACWKGGLRPLPKILCLFLCDLQGLTKLLITGMGAWAKRQARVRQVPERSSLCNVVVYAEFLFFRTVAVQVLVLDVSSNTYICMYFEMSLLKLVSLAYCHWKMLNA